jgi:regulator of protease activity HflC (stomatin/prohibitin superfamily)
MNAVTIVVIVVVFLILLIIPSLRRIGQTEIGLVSKRFSRKKLSEDNPVAFKGEAGYQAQLLMPGIRWKFWILYKVEKFPWVQVAPGEVGVVIAQVGNPLPIGAKSAEYKEIFGNFSDISSFVENEGQKGVQRPVLPPGTNAPIHPVGFLVLTRSQVYGVPVTPELQSYVKEHGVLTPEAFGLMPEQLGVKIIQPAPAGPSGEMIDMVGVVTTYEGDPLPAGDIASRLGVFSDIETAEDEDAPDLELIETLLGTKNGVHNNYQDYQAFLDNGGRIGLQHDPLLYGAYNLNPFLVSVELVPMLVVEQGQVAVIKAYVGLATIDTSGTEFKFGSLVRPGHRGIWEEPLRTGKYPINPRCYQAEIVPTEIITLNWAEASSEAHKLDRQLKQIIGKSREGFVFAIDLQVQIHVPDTRAPKVISMVGTMQNLVNEVLQAAVGNHFRDTLQAMRAVDFIEKRQQVQEDAYQHIRDKLEDYEVVTRGVYIQDVVFPQEMVEVLTQREIANQEIDTYKKQREAQDQRIKTEAAEGTADMQKELARSAVGVDINKNDAVARKAEADGEATFIRETGAAKGAEVEAVGMARAKAYQAQVLALGRTPTALVNAIDALSEGGQKFVPEILVSGGGANTLEALAAQVMGVINKGSAETVPEEVLLIEEEEEPPESMEEPEFPEIPESPQEHETPEEP